MKRCQLTILPTVVVTLVGLLATSNLAQAEPPGYQSPSFYGAGQDGGGQNRPAPPFPASPLAGGFPAAQGDSFMDAHGRPIVMPASFNQSCPSGPSGGYCPTGDPMAVDFGGYSTPDQSGPHYFDVSADVVFLQATDVFTNVPAFTSAGLGDINGNPTNPQLNPSGRGENYEPGFQIAVRYDLGPLSVLEATYMGLYDFGFSQSVRSEDVTLGGAPNSLFSIFSQYGTAAPLISEFDQAAVHQISYESDLQSTEFSYRRYWVGANSRVTGTYLAGFRYVRMTENFAFSSINNLNGNSGNLTYATENDLLGLQLGGDGSICLRQGLRLNTEGKVGVYNNRYQFNSTSNVTSVTPNLQPATGGNQVAFVGEAGVSLVADIWPSISVRGGYQVLYISSLVKVGDNIVTTAFTNPATPPPVLGTQGDALYHGFHGGIEYVW